MSRLDFGVIFKVLEVRKRLDFLYFELELTSRHPVNACFTRYHFIFQFTKLINTECSIIF